MDETALITAARSGDEDAFAELYRLHAGYVKAVGRSILRRSDLDDMCQDTFLLAFTRLPSFEGNARFRTWITRIAINQCLKILRTRRQASNGESNLVEVDGEKAGEDVRDWWLFAREDKVLQGVPARLDLNKLLEVLKPVQRRLLEMAYLEDMPEQEIAETLGITLSCVKSTLHYAKGQAKKILEKS